MGHYTIVPSPTWWFSLNLMIVVFWEVMSCSLVDRLQCFSGVFCLHVQGSLIPWRWREWISAHHWYLSTRRYDTTSQHTIYLLYSSLQELALNLCVQKLLCGSMASEVYVVTRAIICCYRYRYLVCYSLSFFITFHILYFYLCFLCPRFKKLSHSCSQSKVG